MKKTAIFLSVLATLSAGLAAAQETVTARIVSGPQERIGLMQGDVVGVTAGAKNGIIKGDIGTIYVSGDESPTGVIGKCAVVRTFEALSNCQIIRGGREVERGQVVTFPALRFSDPALFPGMLGVLGTLVEPYTPDRVIKVYLYNIYDSRGDVTKLSEQIRDELKLILSQKKRVQLNDSRANREIAFYPEDYPALARRMRDFQKKSDIDVILWGTYRVEGERLLVTVTMIDRQQKDRHQSFLAPLDARYNAASKDIVVPYGQVRKVEDMACTFTLKTVPVRITKDDRVPVIRREAGGNPFIEQQLKALDFSILGASDVTVSIDGDPVNFAGKDSATIVLPRGTHRISTSYRRGYFAQEALIYKSEKKTSRDALLDATRSREVDVEITCQPASDSEPVLVRVYRRDERQLTILRPILRLESDRPLELFKD